MCLFLSSQNDLELHPWISRDSLPRQQWLLLHNESWTRTEGGRIPESRRGSPKGGAYSEDRDWRAAYITVTTFNQPNLITIPSTPLLPLSLTSIFQAFDFSHDLRISLKTLPSYLWKLFENFHWGTPDGILSGARRNGSTWNSKSTNGGQELYIANARPKTKMAIISFSVGNSMDPGAALPSFPVLS